MSSPSDVGGFPKGNEGARWRPYDEAAAAWHGKERARLESLGHPTPFVDGQIAAIAHVNGLVVVTTNDKDFVDFKGLTVQNWSKR